MRLTDSLNKFLKKEIAKKISNATVIVICYDEATNAAQKEMTGILLGAFDEIAQVLKLEYLSLVEFS